MNLPVLRTGLPLRCLHCGASPLASDARRVYCTQCSREYADTPGIAHLTRDISAEEAVQRENYDVQQLGALQTSDPFHSFVSPAGLRLSRMLRRLALNPGDSFVEIACAAGPLSDSLAVNFRARGLATDISPASIERQLERRGNRGHYDAVVASAHELPLVDACVDAVVAFDVIEHLEQPQRLFAEAARVLKPGGRLLLRCPVLDFALSLDWWQYHLTHKRWMQRMERAGHYYRNFRSKRWHRQSAAQAGFQVEYWIGYDVFWDNFIEYALLPGMASLFRRQPTASTQPSAPSAEGLPLRVPQSLPHRAARLAAHVGDVCLWPERLLGRMGFGASMWLLARKTG